MAAKTGLTAADLITMPPPENGQHYELTRDGELIVVGFANQYHEEVKMALAEQLISFVRQYQLGKVYVESMFTVAGGSARIPDLAFVSAERRKVGGVQSGPIAFIPELAIEIISPTDQAVQVERKVWDYLDAGVTEVWQVWIEERRIRVRAATSTRDVRLGEALETPVLPGLKLSVADIFVDIP